MSMPAAVHAACVSLAASAVFPCRSLRAMQGLVLDCSPLQWVGMDVMPPAPEAEQEQPPRWPVWLALDEVTDPVRPAWPLLHAYIDSQTAMPH